MIKSLITKGARRISYIADSLSSKLSARPSKVMLYLNLPQDLDLLLPLIVQFKKGAQPIAVAVSDKAWSQSPRINALLSTAGVEPQIVSHKAAVAGAQPSLKDICAVITASESTANAHKGAYTLTQRANQQGIATYTMQHGYENVGITYFDEEYPVGAIMFASQRVFTWVPLSELPAETPTETRQKCVAVGCPKFIDSPSLKATIPNGRDGGPLIAVFENLHWCRYSDTYRQQFLADLEAMAVAYPQITVLVKPHHTGLWLTKRYQGRVPAADNLIIADPKDPQWEAFTAPALIELADAVITTPSTVAIDAVRAKKPVAVVAYDMALPNYEPLPLLRSQNDWRSLASDTKHSDTKHSDTKHFSTHSAAYDATTTFLRTKLVPGDAAERIIEQVRSDIGLSKKIWPQARGQRLPLDQKLS